MANVFGELHRVLKRGACAAFEVGEVKKGTVRLEEAVIPAAMQAGLDPVFVLINDQAFTKTANLWGVSNNLVGTNTESSGAAQEAVRRAVGQPVSRWSPGSSNPGDRRRRRDVDRAQFPQVRCSPAPSRARTPSMTARWRRNASSLAARWYACRSRQAGNPPCRNAVVDACRRPRTEHRRAYSSPGSRPVAASGASCAWMTRPSNFERHRHDGQQHGQRRDHDAGIDDEEQQPGRARRRSRTRGGRRRRRTPPPAPRWPSRPAGQTRDAEPDARQAREQRVRERRHHALAA